MKKLRILLILSIVGTYLLVLWNGQWEGRLSESYQTWILDLGRSPAWKPPPLPDYSDFEEAFSSSVELPNEQRNGLRITRSLNSGAMALEYLIFIAPQFFVIGLLSLGFRKNEKDPLLQMASYSLVGMFAGAGFSLLLWVIFGGWGPTAPLFMGFMGLFIGALIGLVKYLKWKDAINLETANDNQPLDRTSQAQSGQG